MLDSKNRLGVGVCVCVCVCVFVNKLRLNQPFPDGTMNLRRDSRQSFAAETQYNHLVAAASTGNAEAVRKRIKEKARMTVGKKQNVLSNESTATDLILHK